MKRLFAAMIMVAALMATSLCYSQQGTVAKKPMIEIFTSSTCPPCVTGNLVVDGVLANNPGVYTLIKYQMNWPGTGDPYYMEASGVRRTYYSVSGVPHIRTNGFSPGYPQSWTQSHLDALLTETTNMTITGEASVKTGIPGSVKAGNDGLIIDCHVELKALAAYPAGLKAYIMIAEQNTFGNATTNGETSFHHVVQGYVLPSEGELQTAFAADQVKSFDLSIDLTGSNTETGNDLMMIVFVQDPVTTNVIQSEIIEVTHPFIDYSANFNIYDDDFNKVKGGRMEIALAGSTSVIDSKASASKLLPGSYEYEIVVPGLLPYEGEFTVSDSDIQQDLFVEIPPFLFYEDFENQGYPQNWTFHNPQGDYLVQNSGEIVYQKTQEGDGVYIMLPKIKIDQGSIVSFKVGKSFGRSDIAVGIVSDLADPASSFSEIVSYEIFNLVNMRTFGARIDDPSIVGDGYLCFKISSTIGNYFYLDNVIIIENQPGYKVQFFVKDQNDEILPGAEVVMIDEGLPTNTFGYATWRNVDPGNYNYAVSYNGIEFESGILAVDDDIIKEVVYNTSGIEISEAEELAFFPNPASSMLNFNGLTSGSVKIMTLAGKTIVEESLSNTSQLSISELPAGVYLIQIKCEQKITIQKLIKE